MSGLTGGGRVRAVANDIRVDRGRLSRATVGEGRAGCWRSGRVVVDDVGGWLGAVEGGGSGRRRCMVVSGPVRRGPQWRAVVSVSGGWRRVASGGGRAWAAASGGGGRRWCVAMAAWALSGA
jgi:hypothetical protein